MMKKDNKDLDRYNEGSDKNITVSIVENSD
jgi:hypothetical protein